MSIFLTTRTNMKIIDQKAPPKHLRREKRDLRKAFETMPEGKTIEITRREYEAMYKSPIHVLVHSFNRQMGTKARAWVEGDLFYIQK